MGVTKYNGFRAPYKSETFQAQAASIVNKNGVITMDGVVSESGGVVTVPPFTFIQNGLIVKKDNVFQSPVSSLAAPYYLTVSAATSANIDDLSFQFAKSPEDIASNEAIIAEYDGSEWRMLPFLSIEGVYEDVKSSYADFDLVGPFKGLLTTYADPNFENSPGVLVDKSGERKRLSEVAILPKVDSDPNPVWSRVDRVVYRRPLDSDNRVGVRTLLVGGTYKTSGPDKTDETSILAGGLPKSKVRSLITSDNKACVITLAGYGENFEVHFSKYSEDRTTEEVSETTLFSLSTSHFDCFIDGNDEIHFVYTNSGILEHRKFSSLGVAIGSNTQIDSSGNDPKEISISVDPNTTSIFVAYERLIAPTQNQIYFAKLSLTGTVATAPKALTSTASNLGKPSIFVSDDLRAYVAWQDSDAGSVYYQVFDDIGVPFESSTPIHVSGATEKTTGGTLTDLADSPQVWVTENKSIFVFFRQDRGASNYSVSVWNDGKAYMSIFYGNVDTYSAYVDSIHNDRHVLISEASSVKYIKLKGSEEKINVELTTAPHQNVHTVRDKKGSMFHVWSDALSGTYTTYDPNNTVDYVGPATAIGSLDLEDLAANELSIRISLLPVAPKVGDRLTITNSPSNNGVYTVTGIQVISVENPNDSYKITVGTNFPAAEDPVLATEATFAKPDGNGANYAKTVSELEADAFRYDELESDTLLSRIVMPGEQILNYIPGDSTVSTGSDRYTPYGTSTIDWETTTPGELTISGTLKILDLVNNQDYTLSPGGYGMVEGDALYVVVDGSNFSPSPQITPISTLPFGTPILVLGVLKDNIFRPHLLGLSGMGALESGETVRVDNDLPTPIRQRLGILNDTTYEDYPHTFGFAANVSHPNAIGNTAIMAGQNRHIFLKDAVFSWEESAANTLKIHEDCFFSILGLPDSRNKILPQDVVLDADGKLAYVDLNRTSGADQDLSILVSDASSFTPSRNSIVIARRLDGVLYVDLKGLTIPSGQRVEVNDPYKNPIKLKPHPTDSTLIVVQASDVFKANGSVIQQTLYRSVLKFDGAIINTVTGEIFASDGVTPLGTNYSPPTIIAERFRWFAVSLVKDIDLSDGRVTAKLNVSVGDSDGSTAELAKRPTFSGDLFIGQFYIERNATDTANEPITDANFAHVDTGAGVGGLQTQVDTLTSELNTIKSNNPDFEEIITDGSSNIFPLTKFTLSDDNTVVDAILYLNGRFQHLSRLGNFSDGQWRKPTPSSIEVDTVIPAGQSITVYKPGTAVIVSGGGGSVDLTNINVNPQPDTDGNRSLGTQAKAWSFLFLKDSVTGEVWKLEMNNGDLITTTPV